MTDKELLNAAANLALAAGNLVGDDKFCIQSCTIFDLSHRLYVLKDALDYYNDTMLEIKKESTQ